MAGRIVKRLLAAAILFTPVGTLISTSVQAAIAELETKKANVTDLSTAIPVGMRGTFYTSVAPDNWIKANGAAVPVASYAALAVVIYCGDANNATAAWGYRCTSAATPTTTRSTTGAYIVLPDERGEYSRGWDDGRGIDAGRSLWSWQAGQVLSHTHTATQVSHSHSVSVMGGYGSPVIMANPDMTSSPSNELLMGREHRLLRQQSPSMLRAAQKTLFADWRRWSASNTNKRKAHMRIFHYHPYALIYIGQGLADADRETPGEWVVPAYATKIEPLPQMENKLVVFDVAAQAWKYQAMPVVEVPAETPDEPVPGG